jgi:hypothetical protein
MHYTFDMLIHGDEDVLRYYRNAVEKWREIWAHQDSKDTATFAQRLSSEQFWFEQNCGTRWVGQEIMVVSGFAVLYSIETGFRNENKARHLYAAFQASTCSVEVKFTAERVAESYDLIDSTSY